MYLTAQRVQTRDKKREGINVFIFCHNSQTSQIDWNEPDIALIADKCPGTLMLELIAIPPAMNDVTSYLDIVAPEESSSAVIAKAIQDGAARYPGTQIVPSIWAADSIHLRFQANPLFHPDLTSEFRRLKDRLLSMLGSGLAIGQQRAKITTAPNPLRVITKQDDRGIRFFLDDNSRRVLRHARPELQIPVSLGITHENSEALQTMYGSAQYPAFAIALTGLNLDQLKEFAGIMFLGPNGNVLWSSSRPARW
jgi:hypothetical protein